MQSEKKGRNDTGIPFFLQNPRLRGFVNYAGSSVDTMRSIVRPVYWRSQKKRTTRQGGSFLFVSIVRFQQACPVFRETHSGC